jgi:hypothetical protein
MQPSDAGAMMAGRPSPRIVARFVESGEGPTGFKQVASFGDHLVKRVTVITAQGVCQQPTLTRSETTPRVSSRDEASRLRSDALRAA